MQILLQPIVRIWFYHGRVVESVRRDRSEGFMNSEDTSVLTSEVGLAANKAADSPSEREKENRNHDHITTDHLLPDLKRRTISGGMVTMSAQAAKFGLNLVATVILARLLTPQDFGVVAMVTAVTGFLVMFKHAGLSTPTIQREHITHAQVSNLFWI